MSAEGGRPPIAMHRIVPVVALWALLPAWIPAQHALPLLNLRPGQQTVFDVTSVTRLDMGPASATTDLTLRCATEVRAVEDGVATVRVIWKAVHGEVRLRMLTIRFDSTRNVASDHETGHALADRLGRSIANDIKAPYLALVGFAYDIAVDQRGRILDLPGVDGRLASLRKKLRKVANAKTVRLLASETGLRWQARLLLPARPDRAARVGDSWQGEETTGLGNSAMAVVGTTLHRKLVALKDGVAKMALSGVPRLASNKAVARRAAVIGTVELSLADGLPLCSEITFDIAVERSSPIGVLEHAG